MSREHVDLARKGYEAFARGDLDGVLDMMDPDIEAHNPVEVPEASVHRGREAVRRDWEQAIELFDDFSIEVEDYLDAGDELVVFLRYRARARGSAAEIDTPMAHVLTFREGRAIRLRQYLDRDQALEAAGLR